MTPSLTEISRKGLWQNNPALVQLLGLCPLLAVSNTTVNALGLGIATIFVLTCSNFLISLLKQLVLPGIRLPVFVLIIACLTTCVELLMQALAYSLYQTLGIFLPLIVTNCIILGRAEGFASRHHPLLAIWDGLMMGLGFSIILLLLGMLRELLGTGGLFANMDLLFSGISLSEIIIFNAKNPFLLAILPPGAFLALGLMLALKNLIDEKIANKKVPETSPLTPGSKRVRITGKV
jgi:electron transport complex protein RnfE